jgi:fumarate hydratase subunit beta
MATYGLKTPVSEDTARNLKVGDVFYLSGTVVTARDEAHRRAVKYFRSGRKLPVNLHGLAVFHCGPVVVKRGSEWKVLAAGPTTSSRMEAFEEEFIKNTGVRIIVGKGGMGKRTLQALAKYGAVYGAFTGGAAAVAARSVKHVKNVEWLDLGTPEALWVLEVEEFGPVVVAADTHGNDLFRNVAAKSEENRQRIIARW